jgi:hypothetical protein
MLGASGAPTKRQTKRGYASPGIPRMAKELIRDVQGARSTPYNTRVHGIFPDGVDPFLNLPGRGWNILDREDSHRGV